ncbi:glycoside hydrolase superfamily [Cokeromyces recurvatus]|uniref:glycoside hydrolase superfamily n=1 Tax=Cokeromyces recurvatus TaxID=90255 RepID=UPI002220A6E1|nr:glycoside hydrolase superfamily [Cokeromyces recurvatus]KAI7902882.1 glycoside hydrolase superfamily [Cokeromyces recurvatus]
MNHYLLLILSSFLLLHHCLAIRNSNEDRHRYGDLNPEEYDKPGSLIDADILEMLKLMTPDEKIGQMIQLNQDVIFLQDGTLNHTAVKYYAETFYVGSYLNQLSSNGILFNASKYADLIEEIQEITLSVNSTFKIPIIYGLDNIHGAHYIANSTLFPHGINIAATFNPRLAYESSVITARETRASGVHWTFAPVIDIPVSKQWPRVFENFGEDPHLSSVLGVASIRGYQGRYKSDRSKVAACMKHFIAYGAPYSGQDRDTVMISERTIYDYFVPGFRAAIDAGVATAMESYNDINGEPVVGSERYLRKMLREELGYKGMLITDWQEIYNLHEHHRVAATLKEAVQIAITKTSIDMTMVPFDAESFFTAFKSLLAEGVISMDRLDESAGRLLQLKKDLGLLETEGWKVDRELQSYNQNINDISLSLQAARESITLLKNENRTLPLLNKNITRILVVGPMGNDIGHLAGGWTIFWQGPTEDKWHGDINDEQFYGNGITILEGIKNSAPEDVYIEYLKGFDVHGIDQDMDLVLEEVKNFDAVIVCIGEHVYSEMPGNIHDLSLPEGQIEHVQRLSKVMDNKPLVTVLLEGRPRVLGSVDTNSDAILLAYLPGPWGGQAIGEVLFGITNPSGRLPYTYPKHSGDINLNYWRPVSDVWDPLYEFGHGLSYSQFIYSNITLDGDHQESAILFTGDTEKEISVNITNISPINGMETVLMFIQQPFRTVTPPAKLLKGFQKVFVRAHETVMVRFMINADLFRYTGLDGIPDGTVDNGLARILIQDQQLEFQIINK